MLSLFNSFEPIQCLAFLFIPDAGQLRSTLNSFKTNVATHFPIGYVTDFITILNDNGTTTLNLLEVTVPTGIPGTGSTLTLDLGHQLDYILNATVGEFVSPEASTTVTFYEETAFYWDILVSILAGLYILRRILGSHLIPKFNLR